jgi:hypothetical protein
MNGAQKKTLTETEYQDLIAQQRATIELLEQEIENGKIYENNFVNTEKAAILLCVKPRTIRKYNHEGQLTGRKHKKESRLFFSLKEVLALRESRWVHWSVAE